jgi:hypothetical protein
VEAGSERETLTEMLDFPRATAVNKVAGLTDEQAFGRPVPPSTLTTCRDRQASDGSRAI